MTEENLEFQGSSNHIKGHDEIHEKHKSKEFKSNKYLLVRYGKMNLLGYFPHKLGEIPYDATHVIANTDRGMELAEIVKTVLNHKKGSLTISLEQIEAYCKTTDENYPLNRQGRIIRLASQQDINDQLHLDTNARNEMKFCQELVNKNNLDMKLVDAEHLFGGERIIFYFLADGRVDFRELVKQLASQYQTRIEMRQVGSRDEAKLVADFETCGRECCCKTFLKVLAPVNMRMAKLQKATLDPSKISGRCGRLKCCMRYEDEVYTIFNKQMPKRNSCVKIADGYGAVIDCKVITQTVTVRLSNGPMVEVHINDILERNYKPNEEEQQKALAEENERNEKFRKRAEKRQAAEERSLRQKAEIDNRHSDNETRQQDQQNQENFLAEVQDVDLADNNKTEENPVAKKRKRRRRKPHHKNEQAQESSTDNTRATEPAPEKKPDEKKDRRPRRRRRTGKPNNNENNNAKPENN